MDVENKKSNKLVLIMIVYLAGIFMGAIDTGIVTPARTIIQNALGVNAQTGIWMITIYTLAYAASIPIMGKIADKYGRKYIYLISIFLFGIGSLFCGLSQYFNSFSILIISRAVQAIGGGGILPIATAEFGTTFPKEKRGLALGLVGGVYGIANIFGASAGSAIIDIFGSNNWSFIFFINIPITLFILIAGFISLPNTKEVNIKKIDFCGIFILTSMVLSLLYGLKNIDFFDFKATIISYNVFPFIIVFIILLPFFIMVEKKAQDPVINLNYFKNSRIVITLILSFMTGIVMMGMIFVPQFSENAVKMASGSGGYFVILLGLFAGVGAPLSGKLIDKIGVKKILGIGFIVTILASLFLIFITVNYPSIFTVSICLVLMGLGMGFTMGTPLNYMMLENTDKRESNSSLATLSLIRSIGTAIAPAIMIAFIANAGMSVQTNVMELMPKEINVPPLIYSQEIMDKFDELKDNPAMQEELQNINFPDFSQTQIIEIDMSGNNETTMPADLIALMQSADVTNINERCVILAESMFDEMTPNIILNIQNGIQTGIDAMVENSNEMEEAITGIDQGITQLESLQLMIQDLPPETFGEESIILLLPPEVVSQIPQSVIAMLADINNPSELQSLITNINMQKSGLTNAKAEIDDLIFKMNALKDDVPVSFENAKNSYINDIELRKNDMETTYQSTLNIGFKNVYMTTAIASLIAIFILLFYKKDKKTVL